MLHRFSCFRARTILTLFLTLTFLRRPGQLTTEWPLWGLLLPGVIHRVVLPLLQPLNCQLEVQAAGLTLVQVQRF